MRRLVALALMLTMFNAPTMAQEPISSGELQTLLQKNQNDYVRFVQGRLVEMGLYTGPTSGLLTQSTIEAIGSLCRDAGVAADCAVGPLSYEGARAVSTALFAGSPISQGSATPQAAEETSLPGGWIADIRDGLRDEVVGQGMIDGQEYWDVRLSGRARTTGWSNIELKAPSPAVAGTVVEMAVLVGAISVDERTQARLRMGVKTRGLVYVGEAVQEPPTVGELAVYRFAGQIPSSQEELLVTPYLQFTYRVRDNVDTVFRIGRLQ